MQANVDELLTISLKKFIEDSKISLQLPPDFSEWTGNNLINCVRLLLHEENTACTGVTNATTDYFVEFNEKSLSEKYEICLRLCEQVKALGYKNYDLSFSQFFYPSLVEIRDLVKFLLDCRSMKSSRIDEKKQDIKHAIQSEIKKNLLPHTVNENESSALDPYLVEKFASKLVIKSPEIKSPSPVKEDKEVYGRFLKEINSLKQTSSLNRAEIEKLSSMLYLQKNELNLLKSRYREKIELFSNVSEQDLEISVENAKSELLQLKKDWLEYKESLEQEASSLEKKFKKENLKKKFISHILTSYPNEISKLITEIKEKRFVLEQYSLVLEQDVSRNKGKTTRLEYFEKIQQVIESLQKQEKEVERISLDIALLNKELDQIKESNRHLIRSTEINLQKLMVEITSVSGLAKVLTGTSNSSTNAANEFKNRFVKKLDLLKETFAKIPVMLNKITQLKAEKRKIEEKIMVLQLDERIEVRYQKLISDFDRLLKKK